MSHRFARPQRLNSLLLQTTLELVLSPLHFYKPSHPAPARPRLKMAAAPHTTHPIHLAPLHPSEAAAGAGTSLSTKGSHEVLAEDGPLPRKQWTWPSWQQVELILCASVPLALHLLGLVLLLVALLQTRTPYMKVRQVGGNGLMDYSILGKQSCLGAGSND